MLTLNEAQKEICASSGDMCVVAGAGTGKTTSIISAIVARLERGIPPSRMFIATFTNRSANDIAERAEKIAGSHFKPFFLGTFHKNCLKLICRHSLFGPRAPKFTIIDDKQQNGLIEKFIVPLIRDGNPDLVPDKKEKAVAGDFAKTIDMLKSFLVTPDMLGDPAIVEKVFSFPVMQEIVEDGVTDVIKMACLYYAEYEALLTRLNHMDFGDLITIPTLILSRDESVRRRIASGFDLVVVDEHQDSNAAQRRLAYYLSSEGSLIVVGDDGQSIYGWRGADVRGIRLDAEAMPSVNLVENYRSSQHILAVGNLMLAQDKNSLKKELIACGENADLLDKPELHQFHTGKEETNFIVTRIREKLRQGESPKDIAVLARSNYVIKIVAAALTSCGIPARISGVALFDKLEVRFLKAWIHMLYMEEDSRQCVTHFADFAKNPVMLFGIGDVAESHFIDAAYAHGLRDGLKSLARASSKARDFCELFYDLQETAFTRTLSENISLIADKTGLLKKIREAADRGDKDARNRLEDISAFCILCQDKTYAEFCEMVLLSDTANQSENAVSCFTIHAAKGMEWNHVFIAAFSNEQMGLRYGAGGGEGWRVAYVATTRARHSMTISLPRIDMQGRQLTLPDIIVKNAHLFATDARTVPDDIRYYRSKKATTEQAIAHKIAQSDGCGMNDALKRFLAGDISSVSKKEAIGGAVMRSGILDI